MENACWKCGDLTHHARSCAVDVDRKTKKEIQKMRRAMMINKSPKISLAEKQEKIESVTKCQLPPVKLISEEVARLMDNLCEWEANLQEIQPVNIDVDMSAAVIISLQDLKVALSESSQKVQEIGWIIKKCKSTWLDDEEIKIMFCKWEDIHQKQKIVNDKMYVVLNNYKTANATCQMLNTNTDGIKKWISGAEQEFNGRPLQYLENKKHFKKLLEDTKDWILKFAYLFSSEDTNQLNKLLTDVKKDWESVTKRIKLSTTQDSQSKMLCLICEQNLKEWVLQCGHSYCKECIDKLEETRTTEGIPWYDRETGQTFTGNVTLPKECPYCRGTLVGKIKIY